MREIPLVHGFSARVPRSAVRALRGARGIKSVNRDRAYHLRSTTDIVPAAASTTLDSLRGTIGADGAAGGRTDVALVDSGVSPVGSLAGRVVNGPDFSDDADVDELRSLDAFGHGTHLAGIVAAVAPKARIVNVKVADSDGSTSLSACSRHRLGRPPRRPGRPRRARPEPRLRRPERRLLPRRPARLRGRAAWQQGLVVVASAGNGGADANGLDSPAYDPYVVAVGALDTGATATLADDGIATFSSRGSATRAPDVVAPGTAILSERVPGSFLDEAFPAARIGGGFRGSGTSQAAAVASGAAALLDRRSPGLDPDEVKALLRSGAHRCPASTRPPGRRCRRRGRLGGPIRAAPRRRSVPARPPRRLAARRASPTSSRSRT